MALDILKKMNLTNEVSEILLNCPKVIIPETKEELLALAMGDSKNGIHKVYYEVNGKDIREATVTKCKNGIVVNYDEKYMRRRDPDCMVIGDDLPTDKETYMHRFGERFDNTRKATLDWLKGRDSLIAMPFLAGSGPDMGLGVEALLIIPANIGFFALALAEIQSFIPKSKISDSFDPRAIVYVAPPFRHTHFNKKQVVVHNRSEHIHEIFSYNLYPGPSAKKGIYSVLLDIGEQEHWLTLHSSAVRVVTPYELTVCFMHEGASGAGKSEMTQNFYREPDGKILLATNANTNEKTFIGITDNSELQPVVDDMALCHPSLKTDGKKLVVTDAENGWFLRVDQINHYGTAPEIEGITIRPPEPLVFFSLESVPNSTCLLWEHQMDEPGKACPNPRVIIPRRLVDNIVNEPIEVDVRSFGIRQPLSTRENPNYGIAGFFHVLPPALAWLWRLVAPRGSSNPSIESKDENKMVSEGVGSYWPFSTGKMVTQANLLLEQILNTLSTRHILIPNQHMGVYKVGFANQWMTREFLARRGSAKFKPEQLVPARCPLLGYCPEKIKINGFPMPKKFIHVNMQSEVGDEGYDEGAKILTEFFKEELKKYLTPELSPLGRKIIEACLNDASVQDYYDLIPKL